RIQFALSAAFQPDDEAVGFFADLRLTDGVADVIRVEDLNRLHDDFFLFLDRTHFKFVLVQILFESVELRLASDSAHFVTREKSLVTAGNAQGDVAASDKGDVDSDFFAKL